MILAEKITRLRKQNGWSQEDLAIKLDVSRQSVSKWESAASIPDLNKILKLSEIFCVSTDYLLKDEIEETAAGNADAEGGEEELIQRKGRIIELEEANRYLKLVRTASVKIAAGVTACILSPILLILLGGFAEYGIGTVTENMAGGIGVTVLLLMVAGATAVFIIEGMKLEKYAWLEKEEISLQYGVAGMAEKRKEDFEPIFKRCIVSGVTICIISVIPLLIAAAFQADDIIYIYCTGILLLLIAFAVYLFVWSGMIYGSYQKLLEEGDYSRERKQEDKHNSNLAKVYWCTATAIYVGISLITNKWDVTWIIWPCAGIFFAAVCGIAAMIRKK